MSGFDECVLVNKILSHMTDISVLCCIEKWLTSQKWSVIFFIDPKKSKISG